MFEGYTFEEIAKEIVRKFGVTHEPEETQGYRLILRALQDAYAKGQAVICSCKYYGIDGAVRIDDDNCPIHGK